MSSNQDPGYRLAKSIVNIAKLFFGYNVATDLDKCRIEKIVRLNPPTNLSYIAMAKIDNLSHGTSYLAVSARPQKTSIDVVIVCHSKLYEIRIPALKDLEKGLEETLKHLDTEKIPVLFLSSDSIMLTVPLIPVDLPSALNIIASGGAILEIARTAGVNENLINIVSNAVKNVLSINPASVKISELLPRHEDNSYGPSVHRLHIEPSTSELPELIYYRRYYQFGHGDNYEDFIEFRAPHSGDTISFHYILEALNHTLYHRSLYKILTILGVSVEKLYEELERVKNHFVRAALLIRACATEQNIQESTIV